MPFFSATTEPLVESAEVLPITTNLMWLNTASSCSRKGSHDTPLASGSKREEKSGGEEEDREPDPGKSWWNQDDNLVSRKVEPSNLVITEEFLEIVVVFQQKGTFAACFQNELKWVHQIRILAVVSIR